MSDYAHSMLKFARLTDPVESSDVITVEEAAELSGLSQQTIRRRCLSGEIKANKVGKQWLIHATEFESGTPRRKRSASTPSPTSFDHSQAINHIRRTDSSELWVPDVLRLQDHFADNSSATAEAQRRIEQGTFGPATRILVPKTIYSNRPGTNLDLADRIAYQSTVASFANLLDDRLPENVYSSRLSSDPKYFLAHSPTAYKRFKKAIPEHIEEDPRLEWIGSTDVTAYFDNILHSVLFEELSHAGVAGDTLKSLRIMLSGWSSVKGLGLPQGPNVSRLLGNFYLAPVDEEMTDDPSITYLRYMDDVRILAHSKVEAVAGLRKFEQLCRSRGLTLSSAKTFVESIATYNRLDEDGHLDRVASLFDRNAITKSRPG